MRDAAAAQPHLMEIQKGIGMAGWSNGYAYVS